MISPHQGVGILFEHDGKKCITLPRTDKFGLGVTASIHTYESAVMFSKHFYASLHISSLDCKIVDDESGNTFTSNMQPEESLFDRIDVKYPAPINIYGEIFGVKSLDVRKGCPTSRFDSIEECIKAIEITFKRECGGEPWILVDDNYDSWEEAKARFIEIYSEIS